jgi:hypothetical protein
MVGLIRPLNESDQIKIILSEVSVYSSDQRERAREKTTLPA